MPLNVAVFHKIYLRSRFL